MYSGNGSSLADSCLAFFSFAFEEVGAAETFVVLAFFSANFFAFSAFFLSFSTVGKG